MAIDGYRLKKERRWYKNLAGGTSTLLRVSIALSPEEFRYLEVTTGGSAKQHSTPHDKLYHLCKEALQAEMQKKESSHGRE